MLAALGTGPAWAKGGNPPPPPPPSAPVGPTPPVLLSPAAGASVIQPVTLSWATVVASTPLMAYDWQVSPTSTFASVLAWGETAITIDNPIPGTTDTLSGLPNGAYFWRMRATQKGTTVAEFAIQGAWGAGRPFTIAGTSAGTPAPPVLLRPADLSQYHPFENFPVVWSAVPGVDHYMVEYDNKPTFAQPLFNATIGLFPAGQTNTGFTFGQPFGDLWFRVIAVAADGTMSLPSNVRKVTITFTAPVPPAPLLLAPADGLSSQLPLTLDWTDDPIPNGYELDIATDANFTGGCGGIEWCVPTVNDSQYPLTSLTPGKKFWRVRAWHGDSSPLLPAFTAWSATRSFTVLPTPPVLASFGIDVLGDGGITLHSHTNAFSGFTQDNMILGNIALAGPVVTTGGVDVALSSSNPAVVSVPAVANVSFGVSAMQFRIDTGQVTAPTPVTVTASLPTGAIRLTLTVDPPTLAHWDVGTAPGPAVTAGGTSHPSTVSLNGQAPAAGADVTFTSSNPSLIPAPAPVHIAAGGFTGSFVLATNPVAVSTVVTVTASWLGSSFARDVTLKAAPTLLTPADASVVPAGQAVAFDWTDELYSNQMQVSSSPTFAAPLVDALTSTVSAFTTSTLPSGVLYWRVRQWDIYGTPGPWSVTRSLTVSGPVVPPGPLAAPALLTPADGARVPQGQAVSFGWQPVAGAASYQLQIGATTQAVTGTQFTTSTLAKTTTTWRVRAVDGAGSPGLWSAARSLRIG